MTAADLRVSGLLLYGNQWRAPLARNLGIAESTVYRMERGITRIMPRHEIKINILLEKHDRLIRATLRNSEKQKCTEVIA